MGLYDSPEKQREFYKPYFYIGAVVVAVFLLIELINYVFGIDVVQLVKSVF